MQLVLKFWREMIIVVLVIVCGFSVHSCKEQKGNVALLTAAYSDSVRIERNEKGKWVSTAQTLQATIKQVKEFADQLEIDNKGLKKRIGSLNNLVTYYKAQVVLRDTVWMDNTDTVYVAQGDTVRARKFQYNNGYLSLHGLSMKDKTTISYYYDVDLELVTYYSRSGFLNLKKGPMMTDVVFSDPNVRAEHLRSIVIEEPPKILFEKNWFWGGVGFVLGVVLMSQ